MASARTHEWTLEVLRIHQRLIYKVCWAYAKTPEDREDLFQEIAVRLLSAARNYDPARKLSTWLYRVALNVAIDYHRKQRRQCRVRSGFEGINEIATEPNVEMLEELREMRELLERLSEADRALLLLHLEGNSYTEIGEVLGISESNVGTRLSRLKQSLRGQVQSRTNI